jgi:hypothetical protein
MHNISYEEGMLGKYLIIIINVEKRRYDVYRIQ